MPHDKNELNALGPSHSTALRESKRCFSGSGCVRQRHNYIVYGPPERLLYHTNWIRANKHEFISRPLHKNGDDKKRSEPSPNWITQTEAAQTTPRHATNDGLTP
jgi:hypothetical protein